MKKFKQSEKSSQPNEHPQDMETFVSEKRALGHNMRVLRYYNDDQLCSLIYADFTDQTLQAENYTDHLIKTAFGRKSCPSWSDFQEFLEERCIPRTRAGLCEYLEATGVDEYNPLEIIKKTKGRMAEDQQWIEIEIMI
jgi:hypothetical protein